jgi:hypothetical protein
MSKRAPLKPLRSSSLSSSASASSGSVARMKLLTGPDSLLQRVGRWQVEGIVSLALEEVKSDASERRLERGNRKKKGRGKERKEGEKVEGECAA